MQNLKSYFIVFVIGAFILNACGQNKKTNTNNTNVSDNNSSISKPNNPYYSNTNLNKVTLTDAEWKKVLPEAVYQISRQADTEAPFTGKYWNTNSKGTYYCAACGNKLFRSEAKFSSGCGWPSFFEQDNKNSVVYKNDNSLGMERIEVNCARCNGHLGHIFDDGPEPTGKRYCMNSVALDFIPDGKKP